MHDVIIVVLDLLVVQLVVCIIPRLSSDRKVPQSVAALARIRDVPSGEKHRAGTRWIE